MSGDVFGNGMLLSPHIRLVAAFDHRHVFLDPDPDPAVSGAERRRLFELARSSWADYDAALISEGGGVFARTAKSIPVSPQVQRALDIDADRLTPNELIRAILRAPVDLLFNGGIGTYVKASSETHADAGDKTNDAVRVDAAQLRCRVVGEGGNLGLTQRGRIEFALAGGRVYTDAIDNAGGVNCSDHEVNIKILLNAVVEDGDLTTKQRDELLAEMTDAVAALVLRGSYRQTQALALARAQAPAMLDVHDRFIRSMEQAGRLDRALEALPDAEVVAERRAAHIGLTQPELAVVLAYGKIVLYAALLDSDLPEDEYLSRDLARYFPAPLPERFSEQMRRHRLRREIIATHVTNSMVDRAGSTFAFRMQQDTGASPSDIARAYAIAREVFDMRAFWADIDALDDVIAAETQISMLLDARRLVERATRWLLRNHHRPLDIAATVEHFAEGARALSRALPEIVDDAERQAWEARIEELVAADVPADARRPGREPAGAVRGARRRRGVGRHRPRGRRRGRPALQARLAPAPALVARSHRGPAQGRPLAGDGACGAARRPLQPARRAHRRRPARGSGDGRRRRSAGGMAGRQRRRRGALLRCAPGHPRVGDLRPDDAARRAARAARPDPVDHAGRGGGLGRAAATPWRIRSSSSSLPRSPRSSRSTCRRPVRCRRCRSPCTSRSCASASPSRRWSCSWSRCTCARAISCT